LSDRITSVGEIVRTHPSNGWDTNPTTTAPCGHHRTGHVPQPRETEGSLVNTLGSALNDPTGPTCLRARFHNVNGRTGARALTLPIAQFGGSPIGLIQRPVVNENATAPSCWLNGFSRWRVCASCCRHGGRDHGLPGVTGPRPSR
jgi:hypothetical protein